jgi:hypothetical protein
MSLLRTFWRWLCKPPDPRSLARGVDFDRECYRRIYGEEPRP